MPNGYSEAMHIITKVYKPPFAKLISQGHLSVIFVTDIPLQGNTYSSCCENVNYTVNLLQSLGFLIH